MVSDAAVQALVLMLVLVLPLSALAARRMPARDILRYAAAWIGVFLIGWFVIAAFT